MGVWELLYQPSSGRRCAFFAAFFLAAVIYCIGIMPTFYLFPKIGVLQDHMGFNTNMSNFGFFGISSMTLETSKCFFPMTEATCSHQSFHPPREALLEL